MSDQQTPTWGVSVPRAASAYFYAFAVLVAALVLRHLLWAAIEENLPFITVFGAVAVAVWLGGWSVGLAAAFLGYFGTGLLFAAEGTSAVFGHLGGIVGLLAYVLTCSIIIGFGEAMARAQARAHARGELLRVTLHSIGDAVVTTDVDGRVTSMNAVAEALTGWTSSEGVGQRLDVVFRIIDEATRKRVENPVSRALRDGVIVGLANHTVLVTKSGDECPIDDSAAPITDEHGRLAGCVLVFRDVSAERRVQRERAAQLHTARVLASIIESSDDAIISKSLDGVIQSWNAGAERIFGWSAEQAIGRHISLIIPENRLAEEEGFIAKLRNGERVDHVETERIRADRRRLIVSLTISPIREASGVVVGASTIARDVTRQREAERRAHELLAEAAEANAKFRAFFEQGALLAAIVAVDGTVLDVNRVAAEGCGFTRKQIVGKPVWNGPWWSPSPELVARFEAATRAAAGGEAFHAEMSYFVADGSRRIADVMILPILDDAGRVSFLVPTGIDITDRKRAEAEIVEADRRKNEFLAMLAHELRTPLAPISNTARVLRLNGSNHEEIRTASQILDRQVRQMSRLVDDLIDMSRITSGRIEIRKSRVALAPIVEQAVEAVRPMFDGPHCDIVVTLPSEPIVLEADAARLAQVIGNLLHNACKFSEPGGRVELSAERRGDRLILHVRDYGIGIDAAHLPRLFDMFVQVDTSLERSRGGLGIGLTLVKTLIESHGGTVELRSEGAGQGTEVVVTLPALIGDVAATTPPPRGDAAAAGGGRRVMIVDDNHDSAESLALLMRHSGYETYTTHDGVETIEVAERVRPEVMLLDIGLPGLNGYEVCRRLRSAPWGKQLTLIALTGWGQDVDRLRSKGAGFDAHLVKPVDYDQLLGLLERTSRSDASPT
jgi:PAS domain S-box-containing protein